MRILCVFLLCFCCEVFAQKYMVVNQKENKQTKFLVETIDSVYFEGFLSDDHSDDSYLENDSPLNPTLMATYTHPVAKGYEDLIVSGDTVFAVGNFGLRVIDWTNDEHPVLIAEHNLVDTPKMKGRSITQNGDYLYVVMRQNSSGDVERYVPDLRLTFESNMKKISNAGTQKSSDKTFNAFFEELHIKSFDARTTTKIYLYPARLEKGVYRNIIRFVYLDGTQQKSLVFVSNNYAAREECLNALTNKYKTSKGDSCLVNWNAVVENGVTIENIEVYSATGGNSSGISNNEVLNAFFKKLRISSVNPSSFNKVYLYKAKKESGVYRNIIRFQGTEGSIVFLREDYSTLNDALNGLSTIYENSNGDFCEVNWDALKEGEYVSITDFELKTFGAFDSYTQRGSASIDETAEGAPNNGLYASKLSTTTRGDNYALLSRSLGSLYAKGELSFWLKNVNNIQSSVQVPLIQNNGENVVSIILSPRGDNRYSLGLKTADLCFKGPEVLENSVWYGVKLSVEGSDIKLFYRSKEAASWKELATINQGNRIDFNAISVGIQTDDPNVEMHVDNMYFAKENLDEKSYVNGKLVVFNKKSMNVENVYNLDLKGTGSSINGNALVVDFLKGVNVYDLADQKKPRLVFWNRPDYFKEFQGCAGYNHGGKSFVFISNYTLGFSILDVSDINNVKVVKEDENEDLLWDNSSMYGVSYNFDVLVEYPYVYLTSSTARPYLNTEKDVRGLLVLDISNLNDIKKNIVAVPSSDLTTVVTGDPRPTRLAKIGKRLFVNNSEKGLLVFELNNPAKPDYLGRIEVPGASSINVVRGSSRGKLFVADDESNGNSRNVYLFKGL